jgi:peptide/nickel transport system substrate-binding protein
MHRIWRAPVAALALAAFSCGAAQAQKSGGILRGQLIDNPPSASIHEEGTASVVIPFMPIHSNLVIYDPHEPRNSLDSIRPELAKAWRWNDDKTQLTFTMREGVKWHDGKPVIAEDVKCTFDQVAGLEGKSLRKSPRDAWYGNVAKITASGMEATFHLKRPQPALLALLASGWSPVYPCHVPAAQQRTKPVGAGPFKFVEFRANEGIKFVRNPDYWKKGFPLLDGIEWKIISSRSTRMLSFVSGEFDMSHPTDISVPLLKDIKNQAPKAQCMLRNSAVSTNLIINRDAPPFDNPDLRRALALSLDRKAFVDIMTQGEAAIGGTLLPPPEGLWGMPDEMLTTVVGYNPDVRANREEARKLMAKHGYGPQKHLQIKVSTRDIPQFRDPAVILIDQLKEIWVDGELEIVETSVYYNKVFQKKYVVGLNLTGSSVDDPDQHFPENYACGSLRNYTAYCNKEMEALFEQQSLETDFQKRRQLVWEIDRKLQEDVARPIIFHNRVAGCWHPQVKNLTFHVNSIYNGWRFEDVWLDK